MKQDKQQRSQNLLNKNDVVELVIDNLGINGEGIAHVDGLTVFVKGALVGERVRAKVILAKPTFVVCRLEQILTVSPHRVAPICPVYGKCGGCALQHLSYPEQLAYKQKMVRETLKKVGEMEVEVLPTVPSDTPIGYRNKVSLPIRLVRGETKIGFFQPSSHFITPIDACPLQKPEINRVIALMREFLGFYGGTPYDEATGKGDVRHLVVRSVGGKTYVTVVLNQKTDLRPFQKLLENALDRYALYVNYNHENNNVILGKRTEFLAGDRAPIDLGGYLADVHPAGFFQVNDYIRDKIYDTVCEKIGHGKVIDAYSGAGLMTARVAKNCREVYGIEINPDAHASAVELKNFNDIDNMHPLLGDSADVLPKIADENCAVILDPPRAGCDQKVINALKELDCPIIYVSCNPATLARDLKLLGKKVVSVQPYDMFPQTTAVETVVVLSGEGSLYEMKLQDTPFEKIKSGVKSIELRLLDEKRQKIKEGDSIVFTNIVSGEKIRATVKKLHKFRNFDELYERLPLLRCGYTEDDVKTAHPSDMEKYYSAEQQSRYGVVGIELFPPQPVNE